MTIEVRGCGPDDQSAVAEHVAASREESRRHRGRLDSVGRGDLSHIVAVINDEIVGSLSWVDVDGRRDIVHLYVVPECRGVGVGDALMEELLNSARRDRMLSVTSTVLPGDRESKNMMERHGLVARAIQVEKELG